ncbi:5'-nucleotidase C-terminal domain-containing protein [Algivirga pacifica]|uniref:5'-Nucleotidase C-terminal domain-containing protein n=1 Tax=Algivirga pacifica TaxID=1162670 RepID=A0ABP9D2C6_9BACT
MLKQLNLIPLLFLLLSACSKEKSYVHMELVGHEVQLYELDPQRESSESMDEMLKEYRQTLEDEMHEVIAYQVHDFFGESAELGEFVSALMLASANTDLQDAYVDLAVLEKAALKESLYRGVVTKDHIYRLLPEEQLLVVLTLSGKPLEELLTYVYKNSEAYAGIYLSKENGVLTAEVDGEERPLTDSLRILTVKSLMDKGPYAAFFKHADKVAFQPYYFRSRLISFLKQSQEFQEGPEM